MLRPTHYTCREGDDWTPWEARPVLKLPYVYAIKFEDGSIFDMVSGWRPEPGGLRQEEARTLTEAGYMSLPEYIRFCRERGWPDGGWEDTHVKETRREEDMPKNPYEGIFSEEDRSTPQDRILALVEDILVLIRSEVTRG